jgi:hypothetical protein
MINSIAATRAEITIDVNARIRCLGPFAQTALGNFEIAGTPRSI